VISTKIDLLDAAVFIVSGGLYTRYDDKYSTHLEGLRHGAKYLLNNKNTVKSTNAPIHDDRIGLTYQFDFERPAIMIDTRVVFKALSSHDVVVCRHDSGSTHWTHQEILDYINETVDYNEVQLIILSGSYGDESDIGGEEHGRISTRPS
jgi:hypothetical protein